MDSGYLGCTWQNVVYHPLGSIHSLYLQIWLVWWVKRMIEGSQKNISMAEWWEDDITMTENNASFEFLSWIEIKCVVFYLPRLYLAKYKMKNYKITSILILKFLPQNQSSQLIGHSHYLILSFFIPFTWNLHFPINFVCFMGLASTRGCFQE